jgi:hypothetical protein
VAEWNPSKDICITRLNEEQWDSFEKLIRLNHSKGTLDWNNLNTMLRDVGYIFPDNYVEYRRFSPKVIKKFSNARKIERNIEESVLTGFYIIHRDIKYYEFRIILKNERYYQLSSAIIAKLNKVVKDQLVVYHSFCKLHLGC